MTDKEVQNPSKTRSIYLDLDTERIVVARQIEDLSRGSAASFSSALTDIINEWAELRSKAQAQKGN
jgi:hypothetical protein